MKKDEIPVYHDDGKHEPEIASEEKDFHEKFLGYANSQSFAELLPGVLVYDWTHRGEKACSERQSIFQEHGVTGVRAENTPPSFQPESLSEADWENIRHSDNQLLTLFAAITARSVHFSYEIWRTHHHLSEGQYKRQEALLRSLPLIHATSTQSLIDTIEFGSIIDNQTLYDKESGNPLSFSAGATLTMDRMLGLNRYVFADFGRPGNHHRNQKEITLVIDPDVMNQPGVFMTEHDIADCKDVREYVSGISVPQYFYDTALKKIVQTTTESDEVRDRGGYVVRNQYNDVSSFSRGQDSIEDNLGDVIFSTWEVKLPKIDVSAIRRIIVRNDDDYRMLQDRFGSRFDIVLKPDLSPANLRNKGSGYELFQLPNAFETQYEIIEDEDYRKRSAMIESRPETEREVHLAVFPSVDPLWKHATVADVISKKTNPSWMRGGFVKYESKEEMLADIRDTPEFAGIGEETSHGKDPWFKNISGYPRSYMRCTLATIESLKDAPEIARILDFETFELK